MARIAIAVLFILTSTLAFGNEAQSDSRPVDSNYDELLATIKALERRVAELEKIAKRNADVMSQEIPGSFRPSNDSSAMKLAPVPSMVMPKDGPDSSIPKNWQPFRFNGQWVYMVPLSEASRKSNQRDNAAVPSR